MIVALHVHPRSKRPGVGGTHGDALTVRVSEPAVDGRATRAALTALADALGVGHGEVRLVSGATSRTKIVGIPDDAAARFTRLTRA